MLKVVFTFFLCFLTRGSFASVYSSFSEARQTALACSIAEAIRTYEGATRIVFIEKLRQVAGQLHAKTSSAVADSSLLLYFAFADRSLVEKLYLRDDWFGAHAYREFVRETRAKPVPMDKSNFQDQQLVEKLRPIVERRQNLTWIYSRGHDRIIMQSMSMLASPLFLKLAEAAPFKYRPETLFREAFAIYRDPYTALAVIAWMGAIESELHRDRTKQNVFGFKIEPIVMSNNPLGTQYHFWSYLLRSLYGQKLHMQFLSSALGKYYERDPAEWHADKMGIETGRKVLKVLSNKMACGH